MRDRPAGNCQSDQRDRLHRMVRGDAKGTTFVVYLANIMRVRGLDDAGQQNKRNADNPEPAGPGGLKALS